MVCFNREGCDLVGSAASVLGFLFGFLVFCMVPWSGPWMGDGVWTLLEHCHSMEKPLIA